MHCFRDFPISELVRHMPGCTGDMCGPKERFKGFVPSVHDVSIYPILYNTLYLEIQKLDILL